MNIRTVSVFDLPGPILDVDVADDGRELLLYGDDSARSILLDRRAIPLEPDYRPEKIRFAGKDHVVTTGFSPRNGYVTTLHTVEGETCWQSRTGGHINDVNALAGWIIIGFDDINSHVGVQALSLAGDSSTRYTDVFRRDAVDVDDCYCLCKVDDDCLAFFPYSGFPLVFWNLPAQTQRVVPTPERVAGAIAMTLGGDRCYFFAPWSDEGIEPESIFERKIQGIFEWQIGTEAVTRVGDFQSAVCRIRGLQGGRFLAFEDDSYAIVTMDARE